MATVKQYTTSTGKERYEIFVFAGLDDFTGKQIRVHRRGFRSKKTAELAASRLMLEADQNGRKVAGRTPLFKDFYEDWYQVYANEVRESTLRNTRDIFTNHILPYFGHRRLSDINSNQIQRAVNEWVKIATDNYKKWFRYVARVLALAVKRHLIKRNPADEVSLPRPPEEPGDKLPNFWDRNELATFFSYLDEQKDPERYSIFRVLAFGGLRRGECLALTWGDIDFQANTIRVNKTLTQGMRGHQIVQAPKTRKGRRTVPMDAKTMATLKHWRLEQRKLYLVWGVNTNNPEQLVFATRNNTHKCLNQPGKWLATIEKQHHIQHRITLHGFRHSHASALFAAGATIKEVQTRLGHEKAETTMNIYAHVTTQQNEQAVQKLVGYLGF